MLDVLLRKHRTILKALEIAVPVPADTELIGKAIMEGVVLRRGKIEASTQLGLGAYAPEFDAQIEPLRREIDIAWEAAAEREKKNRSIFAHHQIQEAIQGELAGELNAVKRAVGDDLDVERFVREVLPSVGATTTATTPLIAELAGVAAGVRDALGDRSKIIATFRGRPPQDGELVVRTHPIAAGLAQFVLESALDGAIPGPGRRCGVVRTTAVAARTTALLLRFRFHLRSLGPDKQPIELLAEDLATVAFTGTAAQPSWLSVETTDAVLHASASGNVDPQIARDHLRAVLADLDALTPGLLELGNQRGKELLEAHRRVRKVSKDRGRVLGVELLPPIDVIGAYVYLPTSAKANA